MTTTVRMAGGGSRRSVCPQAELHHPDAPAGYVAWHEWAGAMGKTHRQRRCPGCGRLEIWEPRAPIEEMERG